MEFIKRNSDYALTSLVYMAGFSKERVFDLRSVAKERNVSVIFLHKIFQKLSKKNIVKSHRGIYGGFSLAMDAEQITAKKIVETIQGPIALNKCLTGRYRCGREKGCVVRRYLARLQKDIAGKLEKLTLKNLALERKKIKSCS